jgi:hypothetical protein
MNYANPFKVEAAWLGRVLEVLDDYRPEDGKPILNGHIVYAKKALNRR